MIEYSYRKLEITMANLVIPTATELKESTKVSNDQAIIRMRKERLLELLEAESVYGYFDTIMGIAVQTTNRNDLETICCSGGMPILLIEGL
jgi:hypothetical protein